MKTCGLILALTVAGCHTTMSHNLNGIERARVESSSWPFYSNLTVTLQDPAMQTCLAELGDVGGLEEELCARRVAHDENRRENQLDLATYAPYYINYGGRYNYGY